MPTWISNGTNVSWNDPAAWSGGVPNGADAVAIFPALAFNGIPSILFGGNTFTVGTLTIQNQTTASPSFTSGSGSPSGSKLIMQVSSGSASINVGSAVGLGPAINSNVELHLASNTIVTTSTADSYIRFGGPITGTGLLTKDGPGTLTIAFAPHTWTGGLNIVGGTVVLNSGTGLGAGHVNVGVGTVLDLNNANLSITVLLGTGIIDMGGGALTATQQNANVTNTFLGSADTDVLQITLSASTFNHSLQQASFLNWTDGTDSIVISGNALSNFLTGSTRGESILGNDGVDNIEGLQGNDTIFGGNQIDTAYFNTSRSGLALYAYSSGFGIATRVTDTGGSLGTDLLFGVERINTTTGAFQINGAQANRISNVAASRFDDVVFHNTATGQSYGYLMSFGSVAGNGALSAPFGAAWQARDTGLINADARADIVYQNTSTGEIALGIMGAAGVGSTVNINNGLSSSWRLVGVQDIDGDAWLDLVVQNNNTGAVSVGDMTGTTLNIWTPVSGQGTAWQVRALGDVNGDGRADIIYQNTSTGFISAGLTTSSGTISGFLAITGAATANWTLKEAADMNADGYADVLIQNNANGNISYVNMAGGTPTSYGTVLTGFGTAWQLDGVADTNNDGDWDAIIRNVTGSGDTYVVNMQNGNFQNFTLVAQGIGSQWFVV